MLDSYKKAFQEADAGRLALEQRFRRILASMADVAWASNREGRTIDVSPKVETILGHAKQEMRGSGDALRMGLDRSRRFRASQSKLPGHGSKPAGV
jgi:PAS domain-containing protein